MKFIPVRPHAVSIAPAPSENLNLDEQELRYFQDFVQDRFIDNRRKSLSSPRKFLVTDTFFWTGIVLREGHATPCTRHAIIAISALVRSLHQSWQQDKTGTSSPHHEFALLQYHKALRIQRTAIVLSDEVHGPRTALVACLVLAFFDMLYGHGAFAAQHMAYGRQILTEWRKKGNSLGLQLDPKPDSIDNISRLFLVLDLQASYLTGVRQQLSYTHLQVQKLPVPIPATFKDINEARYVGHVLVSRGGDFRLHNMHFEFSEKSIPPEVQAQRTYFLDQLRLFQGVCSQLLQRLDPLPRLKDLHPLARPESLKIFTTGMLMRLTPGWGSPQTSCDTLTEQFKFMVATAREIMKFEGESNRGMPFLSISTFCRLCYPSTIHHPLTPRSYSLFHSYPQSNPTTPTNNPRRRSFLLRIPHPALRLLRCLQMPGTSPTARSHRPYAFDPFPRRDLGLFPSGQDGDVDYGDGRRGYG